MEKIKINVAELLLNCKKGMELDCALYEDVYFDYVDELDIIHCYIQHETYKTAITFNQYGTYNSDIKSKCVIFPKGKTTWEGFVPPYQFKDGDILFVDCSDGEDKSYQYIFILNKPEFYGKWHSYCHLDGVGDFHSIATYLAYDEDHPRFATEEEKEKLFKVIKDNGYEWNSETKTLEQLAEPKFKVGDKIFNVLRKRMGALGTFQGVISEITDDKYIFTDGSYMFISSQDNYELVPVEPIFKVGDKVKATRINDFIGRIINVQWDDNENQIIYVVEWDDATKSTLPYFANGLQPYKEEKMEDIIKIDIPKGYEFAGFDDDKQQVVFEKISCQYPKNFKECCEVLGCKANDFFTNFSYNGCDVEISEYEDKVDDLLKNFRKLRYVRDAYWKIAGEQMGLGKPWKPDFTNNDEERYSIYTLANKVERDFCGVGDVNTILCFPTEEMRDVFLENFLISHQLYLHIHLFLHHNHYN
jgi:hypothetical protein